MKMHKRYLKVRDADLDIREAFTKAVKKHGLTFGEIFSIIASLSATWSSHMVRAERHPNDPDKKGDEA